MIKYFEKLIRDKIPQIIKESGLHPEYHELTDEEDIYGMFIEKFREKLWEIEHSNKKDITEELADIIQIALCYGKLFDITQENIEEKRLEKLEKKGNFSKKLFLEYIVDKGETDAESE